MNEQKVPLLTAGAAKAELITGVLGSNESAMRALADGLTTVIPTAELEAKDALIKELEWFRDGAMTALNNNAAKIAELEKDAERYRWLRNSTTGQDGEPSAWKDTGSGEGSPRLEGEELDVAIDAAIAGETK